MIEVRLKSHTATGTVLYRVHSRTVHGGFLATPIRTPTMSFEYPSLNLPKKFPGFGHALLPYFLFSPGYVCLNHGSYGSLPKPVFDFSTEVAKKIEENPDQFMRVDLANVLRDLRVEVAPLINADESEIVFVPNASHGINTVLRNLVWHPEDVIIGGAYHHICCTFCEHCSRSA